MFQETRVLFVAAWNDELMKCFRDSFDLVKFSQRASTKMTTNSKVTLFIQSDKTVVPLERKIISFP